MVAVDNDKVYCYGVIIALNKAVRRKYTVIDINDKDGEKKWDGET